MWFDTALMSGIDPILAAQRAAYEAHFIQRVRERFGIKLSPARYRLWCMKVEDVEPGTKYLGETVELGRTAWKIRAGGIVLRVIFDEPTQCLVTALPYGKDDTATLHRREVLRQRRLEKKDPDWLQKKRRILTTKTQRHRGQKPEVRGQESEVSGPSLCASVPLW